ncbi:YkgJ family cysteine cluster protein [Desulfovibrio litoralis]|uniref:Zinc-or iron-chelating domain-containing protein n=1 Tax=Desulfovibrio litoralis DSM 11393 TaxID=1121455 RepID=A0A1M7SAH7_9BACT|nr:YkgJ family cysteine cluster protein [Desulfovibrio litoralis]SHN55394.1 hypothetical protein SAMN02745728_00666 [Desulfovibrio litoralis DSM 11393]
MDKRSVFECKLCGICCEGSGGIVLSEKDLKRIAEHFRLDEKTFLSKYAEFHNAKWKIKTAEDGFCVFFKKGVGCDAHIARPDICRAWPFFRGNMIDKESFELAKDYCRGLRKDATHEEFVKEGRAELLKEGLLAKDRQKNACALCLDDF